MAAGGVTTIIRKDCAMGAGKIWGGTKPSLIHCVTHVWQNLRRYKMQLKLVATTDGIELYSPYSADLVADIKRLPYMDRKWDGVQKCWIVSMKHKDYVIKLCIKHFLTTPPLQGNFNAIQAKHTKLFRIEYIGGLKDRDDGKLSALGALDGSGELQWTVLLYESVLRQFFEGGNARESLVMTTHYSILALKRGCTQDDIKSAYRKMAKRYHPDVNRDEDANEVMVKVQRAYDVLRNPAQRAKYDTGLELQSSIDPLANYNPNAKYWTPPLRCGLLLCDGYYEAGRFIVERILQWDDIVESGRTLVTSWDKVQNTLVRNWI